MAQKEFDGEIQYDWELWIGREATPGAGNHAFTQIYGFTDLPFPDQSPQDQDVTHLQSPGRTNETTPGLLPVVDWSQDKQLWAADPGDVILFALDALTALGTKENVLIEFNLDPEGGSIRRTYAGYVNTYTPAGAGTGGVAIASLMIKIHARQASNARVIS